MHTPSLPTLRRGLLAALAAGTLTVLAGCPSTVTYTTAQPVQHGYNEVAIAPSVTELPIGLVDDSDATIYVPTVDVTYRHGFGDAFDLGISLQSWGRLGIDFKLNLYPALTAPEFETYEDFADYPVYISLDPGVSGVFFGVDDVGAGYVQFDLPLLIDVPVTDWFLVTFAVKYTGLYSFATNETSSDSVLSNLIGGTFGMQFRVSDLFSLHPFGGASYWIDAPGDVPTDVLWHGGMAFKFTF